MTEWEPLIQSLQNIIVYPPGQAYYLIRFWGNSVGNFFCKFSLKMCFFKVKHSFGHISRTVGVKRKGSASVGFYVTLIFDLTHDLDLWFFKVIFWNSSISGIVGLINVKWKGSELIRYWANCMTFPLNHTHDLDLGSVKVCVWNSLISGTGRPIDMEWKGYEPSIHGHDIDFVWPWWDGWMYQIVTGVTSDVSVPST